MLELGEERRSSLPNLNKNALTAATRLACLKITQKNEEEINSTRSMIINNNELYLGIRSAINPSI